MASRLTEPCLDFSTTAKDSVSPSTSRPAQEPSKGTSSSDEKVAASVTGASLTAVTVTLTAAAVDVAPSETSMEKTSVPLKSWAGVYVTAPEAASTQIRRYR